VIERRSLRGIGEWQRMLRKSRKLWNGVKRFAGMHSALRKERRQNMLKSRYRMVRSSLNE